MIKVSCQRLVDVVHRLDARAASSNNFHKYAVKQPVENPAAEALVTQWLIPKYRVDRTQSHAGIGARRPKSMQRAWYRKVFQSTMALFVTNMAEEIAQTGAALRAVHRSDDEDVQDIIHGLMSDELLATIRGIVEAETTLPGHPSLLLKKLLSFL